MEKIDLDGPSRKEWLEQLHDPNAFRLRPHPETSDLIPERWEEVDGYDGYYEISNYGRVRSWKNNRYGRSENFRILRQTINTKGYPKVSLTSPPSRKTHRTHRLVGRHFIPNPEDKIYINHKDGIKLNPFYLNLEWCTKKEDVYHARNSGLCNQKGENSPNAKLTKGDVYRIRYLYKTGKYLRRKIGDMFGVSPSNINLIVNRKRWKHI